MNTRNTIQKELVWKAVSELGDHPTPEEVYQHVCRSLPQISRATVYRNLSVLHAEGRLLKIGVPDGPVHVDHNLHRHYHVLCQSCERLYDVDMPYLDDLLAMVRNTNGFEITSHHLLFGGLCPDCLEKAGEDSTGAAAV